MKKRKKIAFSAFDFGPVRVYRCTPYRRVHKRDRIRYAQYNFGSLHEVTTSCNPIPEALIYIYGVGLTEKVKKKSNSSPNNTLRTYFRAQTAPYRRGHSFNKITTTVRRNYPKIGLIRLYNTVLGPRRKRRTTFQPIYIYSTYAAKISDYIMFGFIAKRNGYRNIRYY